MEQENKWTLDSGRLRLTFSMADKRLELAEMTDIAGAEWISGGKGPLWRMTVKGPDGKTQETSSQDAEAGAPERSENSLLLPYRLPLDGATAQVTLKVTLDPGSALSRWGFTAEFPDGWVLVSAEAPVLPQLAYRDGMKVAMPTGWGVEYDVTTGLSLDAPYPSWAAVMQFLGVYEGGKGLYIASHDPNAHYKHFVLKGSETSWSAHVKHWAPMPEIPISSYQMPFEVIIGVFDGSAYEAAQLYRPFALSAPWSKSGPVSRRSITPWLLNTELWLKPGETPWTDDDAECIRVTNENVAWCVKAREFFDVPISLHWYRWHQIPYDTLYPEYFPPKAGFLDGVKAAQTAGFRVMPYINGRLCDPESITWKERGGAECAVRDAEGNPYTEVYGSKVPLNPMCPKTALWQKTIPDLVGRLIEEVGVDGVYIDQITAAQPRPCFGSNHGHVPGGGAWWAEGYRELLAKARTRLPEGGMLTSEENAECWNDLLDGLLIVNTPTNDGPLVPLYPAVYSGWVIPFGFQYFPKDETLPALSFRVKMARAYLWGSQPGWIDAAKVMADGVENDRDFLRSMVRTRRFGHPWLVYGRFLGEREARGDNPRLTGEGAGSFGGTYAIDTPAVMASAWVAEDGRHALAVTNMDDAPHTVTVDLPAPTPAVKIWGPEGMMDQAAMTGPAIMLEMPARSARIVEVVE